MMLTSTCPRKERDQVAIDLLEDIDDLVLEWGGAERHVVAPPVADRVAIFEERRRGRPAP